MTITAIVIAFIIISNNIGVGGTLVEVVIYASTFVSPNPPTLPSLYHILAFYLTLSQSLSLS